MTKKRVGMYILGVVIAVIAALILIFGVFGSAPEDGRQESMQAIRNTIMEKSLQCYVIEGAYPDDLSYLEEHYGLIVNHRDYYIVYTPVAQNLPPQIVVAAKNQKNE